MQLTLLGLDVILDSPSGVRSVLAVDRGGVVLRLVKDVDLVLGTEEHL